MAPRKGSRLDQKLLRSLNRNVQRLAQRLEADNVAAFVTLTQRPFRMMWVNLMAGLARGVGIFVGAGLMGGIVVALLGWGGYHLLKVSEMFPVLHNLFEAARNVFKEFINQYKPSP